MSSLICRALNAGSSTVTSILNALGYTPAASACVYLQHQDGTQTPYNDSGVGSTLSANTNTVRGSAFKLALAAWVAGDAIVLPLAATYDIGASTAGLACADGVVIRGRGGHQTVITGNRHSGSSPYVGVLNCAGSLDIDGVDIINSHTGDNTFSPALSLNSPAAAVTWNVRNCNLAGISDCVVLKSGGKKLTMFFQNVSLSSDWDVFGDGDTSGAGSTFVFDSCSFSADPSVFNNASGLLIVNAGICSINDCTFTIVAAGSGTQSAITSAGGVINITGNTKITTPSGQTDIECDSGTINVGDSVSYSPTKVVNTGTINGATIAYTPTLTNGTNVATSSNNAGFYKKTGNSVRCYGKFTMSTTLANSSTILNIGIPVASTFGNDYELSGSAIGGGIVAAPFAGRIFADTSNNNALVDLRPTATTSVDYSFNFEYIVH